MERYDVLMKLVLNKQSVTVWTIFIWLRIRTSVEIRTR